MLATIVSLCGETMLVLMGYCLFSLLPVPCRASGSKQIARSSAIMRKKVSLCLTLLAIIGLAPLLGACNTTAGVGEDLSAGGHALTNSAEKHAP
jgi:entericidin B